MRFLVLFLFAVAGSSGVFARSQKLDYTFTVDTARAHIHVVLRLQGAAQGSTVLHLPDSWASESHLFRALKHFRVTGKGVSVAPVTDSAKRTVRHAPGAALVVSYDLKQEWKGGVDYPRNFRAVIQPHFFQSTGYALLVRPEADDRDTVALTLDWTGLPSDWTVGNSFHSQTRRYSNKVLAKDLLNTVFVAGDFRILEQRIGGQPLYVAVRGQDWTFTDAELLQRIGRIVTMERQFWNDYTEPYYFVSLIPFQGRGSMNGTSLHQAFMLGMTPEQPLEDWLLAHEYFHRWNGTLISLQAAIEQEHSWFSEGFTEFYTYKLMRKNGLLADSDYLNKINNIIAQYYLSPVRNKDRETVGRNFWADGYKDLPYKQGFVYALYLDNVIRQGSAGRYSLDTVMRALYALSKTKDSLREEDFTALISQYAGHDLSIDQHQYIDSGHTIPVLPLLLGRDIIVQEQPLNVFDAGFDIKATVTSGIVTGVEETGPAWRAGLRNGQKAKQYDISRGNTTRPLEITVEDAGVQKSFSYLPVSTTSIAVPQLVFKDALMR